MKYIIILIDNKMAIYQLTFSNVGQGNGNYVIKENNALGRVL